MRARPHAKHACHARTGPRAPHAKGPHLHGFRLPAARRSLAGPRPYRRGPLLPALVALVPGPCCGFRTGLRAAAAAAETARWQFFNLARDGHKGAEHAAAPAAPAASATQAVGARDRGRRCSDAAAVASAAAASLGAASAVGVSAPAASNVWGCASAACRGGCRRNLGVACQRSALSALLFGACCLQG